MLNKIQGLIWKQRIFLKVWRFHKHKVVGLMAKKIALNRALLL